MKAVKFREHNRMYAEDQPEYLSLPAHRSDEGIVTTCWKLSFLERIRVILTGKVYAQAMTFDKPLQPLKMSVSNPVKGGKNV